MGMVLICAWREGGWRMREIEKAIRQKRELLAKTQRDLEALERALAVLNEEPTPDGGSPAKAERPSRSRRGTISQDSATGRALMLLAQFGTPQHIDTLIVELRNLGCGVRKSSLVSAFSKLAKRGLHVYRDGPGRFGLLEWRAFANGNGNGAEPQMEATA